MKTHEMKWNESNEVKGNDIGNNQHEMWRNKDEGNGIKWDEAGQNKIKCNKHWKKETNEVTSKWKDWKAVIAWEWLTQMTRRMTHLATIKLCQARGRSWDLQCCICWRHPTSLQEDRRGSPTLQIPSWRVCLNYAELYAWRSCKTSTKRS